MIRIVCGPPAAGKTSYVAEHKKEGDVVVDFDAMATALGSPASHQAPRPIKEVTFAARKAAIARIFEGVDVDAWIIQSNPAKPSIERWGAAGARFILVDPGEEQCISQAQEDDRPEPTIDLIRQWYHKPPTIPQAWLDNSKKGAQPMKIKTAAADVKASDLEKGEFVAYASTFDREPDAYGDIVARGAFKKTIREWKTSGNVIPVLYGHRMDDPDYNIGAVISAEEDDRGLKIRGRLDLDSPKGAQVYRLIKGRRLSQLSFAFDVVDAGTVTLSDGSKATELRELKIYEISLVPIGANQNTEVLAVKEAAEVLAASAKAGRQLSDANADRLQGVLETLDDAVQTLKSCLAETGQAKGEDASGTQAAPLADAQETKPASPSADSLELLIALSLAGISAS